MNKTDLFINIQYSILVMNYLSLKKEQKMNYSHEKTDN